VYILADSSTNNFYIIGATFNAQVGNTADAPLAGATAVFGGIVPIDKFDCGTLGSLTWPAFDGIFKVATIDDTICHAGIVSFTSHGGGHYAISNANGDIGSCVTDHSQASYCITGLKARNGGALIP
jgi:hypothetical protein